LFNIKNSKKAIVIMKYNQQEVAPSRPDVLHIIEPLSFGCLTALANLVTSTAALGLRHAVLHGTERTLPDAKNKFPPETAFFPVPTLRRDISLRHDWAALQEINTLVQKIRPRMIHCHSSKAGVLGRLVAWHKGIASLYTPHGFSFLQTDISDRKKRCFKNIEWAMARLGTAIVACGKQEYAITCKLISPRSVFFIPNALQTSLLDAVLEQPSREHKQIVAGTCGRVSYARNAGWICAAAAATREQLAWQWIGCGNNNAFLTDEIEQTPYLDHKAALEAMHNLDIYVQPSRWEGLSFSLLEAMYLGKPVIASHVPANAAIIRHGETGFLVNNIEELIICATQLATDPALRARIGTAAHDYVAKEHDARSVYQQYIDLYTRFADRAP
jgi:glycosyltransferase involved in cell wall biosynthesis